MSGTTIHAYDEHGELLTTTDARGIVTTRLVDELGRLETATYSDGTPGTSYAYGTGLRSSRLHIDARANSYPWSWG